MNDDLMSRAVREFRIDIEDRPRPDDARSGAGVHPARTRDGRAAYLKLTPARLGSGMLDRARRELSFYQRLADRVPVSTPPLLGALDTDAGVALLLGAARKQVKVEAWSEQAWAALGRDLARLHAVPVAAQDGPDQDGLLKTMSEPVSDEVTEFWGEVLPELLASLDAMRAELAAQPAVFIHGDCHTGNIVHGPEGLVFCDWQCAGPGRATADLAHLSVRATPVGVTIPREMMTAYLDGRGVDAGDLERALVPAELAVLLLHWPPYAVYNSQDGIERVHRRARLLARKWLRMTSPTAGQPQDFREAPLPADLAEQVRAICLALPEVTERLSHGAPTWFIRGKSAFVTLWAHGHHDDDFPHLCCAGPPGVQQELIAAEPQKFFRPPYVGGRGWIGLRLDADPDWAEIGELCQDAYRVVAPARLAAKLDG